MGKRVAITTYRSKRGTAGISDVCIAHPRMITGISSLVGNFCGNDDEEGRSSSYLVIQLMTVVGVC